MARVPSDPAQWPSATPPGEVPKQKPDPTALILRRSPTVSRSSAIGSCRIGLRDRLPIGGWPPTGERRAVTLFEQAVRQLPDDRAAAFRQTLRSAGETTVESVLRLYQQVGRERRQQRLAALFARSTDRVHEVPGPGTGLRASPGGFRRPGRRLRARRASCLLEFDGSQLHTRTLVERPKG